MNDHHCDDPQCQYRTPPKGPPQVSAELWVGLAWAITLSGFVYLGVRGLWQLFG